MTPVKPILLELFNNLLRWINYRFISQHFICRAILFFCLLTTHQPILAQNSSSQLNSGTTHQGVANTSEFTTLPVGINVGDKNMISSTFIRGFEDGQQAVNLPQWLISFKDVVQALELQETTLEDGQIELRSPGLFVRLQKSDFTEDPELGVCLTVDKIQNLLKVPVQFDLVEYAVRFDPPWLNLKVSRGSLEERPIVIEGLTRISPSSLKITDLTKETRLSSTQTNIDINNINVAGRLTMVGTVLGGSVFLNLNQSDFLDRSTWKLADFQYLRSTPDFDLVLGRFEQFWGSLDKSAWGLTAIQRWGYTPRPVHQDGMNSQLRLQPENFRRTVRGVASPNTLIHLVAVDGAREFVIGETIVDQTGMYEFKNVPSTGRRYKIRQYPDGLITENPQEKEIRLSRMSEQLHQGSSALIVSAAFAENSSSNQLNLFPELQDLNWGILYRYGLFEDLTLGMGWVQDQTGFFLGELFYQPQNIPLEFGLTVRGGLTGDETNLGLLPFNYKIRYHPSSNFQVDAIGNYREALKYNLSWRLFPNLTWISRNDPKEGWINNDLRWKQKLFRGFSINTLLRYNTQQGVTYSLGFRGRFDDFSMTGFIQNEATTGWSWQLSSTWDVWQFNYQQNSDLYKLILSYDLLGNSENQTGLSKLYLSYTQDFQSAHHLASLIWSYRLQSSKTYREYIPLELDLGYGISDRGQGVIIALNAAITPTIGVRVSYQQVSLSSEEDQFNVEFIPRFDRFLGRINATIPKYQEERTRRLRNQGGLLIKPYLDINANQQLDPGEKVYLDNLDLLLILNSQPLDNFFIFDQGVVVERPPGIYRLDLDEAGYPIDWTLSEKSYAIDVVPGSYTPVLIGFQPSYTIAGKILDQTGKPVTGAKIEAIAISGDRQFSSITDSSGIFFLEGLVQGKYQLKINDQPATPDTLELTPSSQQIQEINFTL